MATACARTGRNAAPAHVGRGVRRRYAARSSHCCSPARRRAGGRALRGVAARGEGLALIRWPHGCGHAEHWRVSDAAAIAPRETAVGGDELLYPKARGRNRVARAATVAPVRSGSPDARMTLCGREFVGGEDARWAGGARRASVVLRARFGESPCIRPTLGAALCYRHDRIHVVGATWGVRPRP